MWFIYDTKYADRTFVQLQLGICDRLDFPECDRLRTVKRKIKLYMNSVTHKSHSRSYFRGLIQTPRNVFCYCQTCKICCHFILVYCHCLLRTTFRKCKEQNICYNHYPHIIQISSFSWIYNLLIQIKILEHCSPNTICPKNVYQKAFITVFYMEHFFS